LQQSLAIRGEADDQRQQGDPEDRQAQGRCALGNAAGTIGR
jgi:hypothetical protein